MPGKAEPVLVHKARADLQSSMRDAAMTQGAEVSRLQSEVQSARQHAADEALAERLQADRHAQQQEATQRALEQQSAALRQHPCGLDQTHNERGSGNMSYTCFYFTLMGSGGRTRVPLVRLVCLASESFSFQ